MLGSCSLEGGRCCFSLWSCKQQRYIASYHKAILSDGSGTAYYSVIPFFRKSTFLFLTFFVACFLMEILVGVCLNHLRTLVNCSSFFFPRVFFPPMFHLSLALQMWLSGNFFFCQSCRYTFDTVPGLILQRHGRRCCFNFKSIVGRGFAYQWISAAARRNFWCLVDSSVCLTGNSWCNVATALIRGWRALTLYWCFQVQFLIQPSVNYKSISQRKRSSWMYWSSQVSSLHECHH